MKHQTQTTSFHVLERHYQVKKQYEYNNFILLNARKTIKSIKEKGELEKTLQAKQKVLH